MAIAVIRMKGGFSLSPTAKDTLESLRLGRLYACTLISESGSSLGMLQSAKDVVSFGTVGKEAIALLLAKRGCTLDGKKLASAKKPEEIRKILEDFMAGKKLSSLGVSPVFRLSPPKGGFGSRKEQAPLGPLGKNEKIAELISRMA